MGRAAHVLRTARRNKRAVDDHVQKTSPDDPCRVWSVTQIPFVNRTGTHLGESFRARVLFPRRARGRLFPAGIGVLPCTGVRPSLYGGFTSPVRTRQLPPCAKRKDFLFCCLLPWDCWRDGHNQEQQNRKPDEEGKKASLPLAAYYNIKRAACVGQNQKNRKGGRGKKGPFCHRRCSVGLVPRVTPPVLQPSGSFLRHVRMDMPNLRAKRRESVA